MHRYLPQCTATRPEAAPGHETRQWGRLAHNGAGKQPAPTHRYLPQCTATRPEAAPETGHGPCEAGGPGMAGKPRQRSPPARAPRGPGGHEQGAGARTRTRQEDTSGARAQKPGHAKRTRAGRGRKSPDTPRGHERSAGAKARTRQEYASGARARMPAPHGASDGKGAQPSRRSLTLVTSRGMPGPMVVDTEPLSR